jgi:methionyl-tRNA formyltransferase
MRLILMGTGPFAVPSFQALLNDGHEIAHVVTRPVVATSNKKEPPTSPVRQWAIDHHLPLADPISINDHETVQWLKWLNADLMVVCDYGQILSRDALSTTKLGGINLHGSLLPKHRGAAPVQWSILSGDSVAGVSIIHMTPALDGGPVLSQSSTEIGIAETAAELESRLSQIGVQSTLESVAVLATKSSLENCVNLGQKQDKALATKAPRLAKDDGELNLHYQVGWIDRLIRGLQPWPGSFAHLTFPDGKTLRIILPHATPIEMNLASLGLEPGDLLYGETLRNYRATEPTLSGALYAVALDGLLEIPAVQPAGKKLMSSQEFLRGYARYTSMKIECSPGSHRLLNKMSCT